MTASVNAYWSMTEGVYNCLIDAKRTRAFRAAIRRTVRAGDVVVDLGSGSGVLAMFATEAGARQVYAVELDERNTRTLQDVFRANGYGDRISVIEGDATRLRLPEPPNVVIAELIATGLIEELQVPAMNNILRQAKCPRVLVKRMDNFADLVSNPTKFYGHAFDIVRYEYPDFPQLRSTPLTNRARYASVDLSIENRKRKISARLPFTVRRKGVVNAVRICSETVFHDGSRLGATFSYCYPVLLPVPESVVAPGDRFELHLSYVLCGGFKTLAYSLERIIGSRSGR